MFFVATACEKEEIVKPGYYNPDAIDWAKCEFSDQSEWIVGQEDELGLSYNIKVIKSCKSPLKLNVKATLPGQTYEAWSASTVIESPVAGDSYSGKFVWDSLPDPGFYQCEATLNGKLVRKFNMAVDVASWNVEPDHDSDFSEFWTEAVSDLDKIKDQQEMSLNENLSNDGWKVYDVVIHSAGDFTGDSVEIRGWYIEPVGKTGLPLKVAFFGYDFASAAIDYPTSSGSGNEALLKVYTRGQGLNRINGNKNPYGEWVANKLGSPKDYYYRGAYLDAAATIRFGKSLPNVDKSRIYVHGGSQGGALALAAAALCPETVRFAVLAFPFMGNFPLYLSSPEWPATDINRAANNSGLERSDILHTLSYFDTKNMATMVRCPVLVEITLQDPVCPPWTQFPIVQNVSERSECQWHISAPNSHKGDREMNARIAEFINNHL